MDVDINIEDVINKRDILFSTKSIFRETQIIQEEQKKGEELQSFNGNKIKKKLPKIQGNPASLLCLNINSYMGGASDVWNECRGFLLFVNIYLYNFVGKVGIEKESKINFETQNFSDGKLEFLTFSSSLKLAEERFFKGQAKQVAQGSGPFLLNFKKSENSDLPLKTFFQIDGEYYEIVSPNVCTINKCSELPNGKIKVLVTK